MKLLLALSACVCSAQPLVISAQWPGWAMDDYALGREVGGCLVRKCQVFRGRLMTESPKSGVLVTIQIDETWLGAAPATEKVEVPYSSQIFVKAVGASPGYPWVNVDLSGNLPLTVVLARERIGAVKAGAPVRVTSDSRTSDLIRTLAEEARQLERSPTLISEAVFSLSGESHRALAGYLSVVADRIAEKDPELSSSLFQHLIGNTSVPPAMWNEIADRILFNYRDLSGSGKGTVVRRFTELAQQSNLQAAQAGFRGLAKISTFDTSIQTLVPSTAVAGLSSAYRALVQKGQIPPSPQLEAGLGIKPQRQ